MNKRLRFQILERDNFTCGYCGAQPPIAELHVDHRHPKSKGGLDEPDNLVAACIDCNLGKSDGDAPKVFLGLREFGLTAMALEDVILLLPNDKHELWFFLQTAQSAFTDQHPLDSLWLLHQLKRAESWTEVKAVLHREIDFAARIAMNSDT